jgi:hypothetical protein
LEHKKLHAKKPSGEQFEAQKVAREKAHPEHDLKHKKLRVKRPIRDTI